MQERNTLINGTFAKANGVMRDANVTNNVVLVTMRWLNVICETKSGSQKKRNVITLRFLVNVLLN